VDETREKIGDSTLHGVVFDEERNGGKPQFNESSCA
jgi:hypothetical protein